MQYHVIDVFTDKLFGGNPAGVCLLDEWLPDDRDERVKIGGRMVRYLTGNLEAIVDVFK
jgi:predicted PhzF superfamily epimerase YddE/YHI9